MVQATGRTARARRARARRNDPRRRHAAPLQFRTTGCLRRCLRCSASRAAGIAVPPRPLRAAGHRRRRALSGSGAHDAQQRALPRLRDLDLERRLPVDDLMANRVELGEEMERVEDRVRVPARPRRRAHPVEHKPVTGRGQRADPLRHRYVCSRLDGVLADRPPDPAACLDVPGRCLGREPVGSRRADAKSSFERHADGYPIELSECVENRLPPEAVGPNG
jgi:hypothetical protein